ncbi:MAG: AAA family ATPase, partial [Pseudomonadota bacterium]
MITTLAVANYRSLLDLAVPFGPLNVITGENASGKSNLYKALRLLSETAQGGVINSLAREGGLSSTFWAGPETLSKAMREGHVPVQGGPRQKPARLRLGFSGDEFGYAISLGLPVPGSLGPTAFGLDPEIKRESIWAGHAYRPASALVERDGAITKVRSGRSWRVVSQYTSSFESMFNEAVDPEVAPEIITLREQIKRWRFYDHFRSDAASPARQPQLGTRTPVLHNDGRDLAAAIQTIIEIGDADALHDAVVDAFPGA